MTTPLTIGAVAGHFGVPAWRVRRLFQRGILPPAARVGVYRVVDPGDLPQVERALISDGYLGRGHSRPTATGQAVTQ
jgi:hypothetical protein